MGKLAHKKNDQNKLALLEANWLRVKKFVKCDLIFIGTVELFVINRLCKLMIESYLWQDFFLKWDIAELLYSLYSYSIIRLCYADFYAW